MNKNPKRPKGWSYGRWSKGCKGNKRGVTIQGFHFWHMAEKPWLDGCVVCGRIEHVLGRLIKNGVRINYGNLA